MAVERRTSLGREVARGVGFVVGLTVAVVVLGTVIAAAFVGLMA